MPRFGRRIFYELTTGKVLRDTGEREGDVKPTSALEDFPVYDNTVHNFMQLAFGDRAAEFESAGSYEVDPATAQIIIYPVIRIAYDKAQIKADGVDTLTVTASGVAGNVTWAVNDGQPVQLASAGGKSTFQFSSSLEGVYTITASDLKHGKAAVFVEVIL